MSAAGEPDTTKDAYQHAFVVLGASSATATARPGASALLEGALTIYDRFWDEDAGPLVESFDRTWQGSEPHRTGPVGWACVPDHAADQRKRAWTVLARTAPC